ncbi:hypothetical protein Agub_g13586, partial [Astrephomene gubernaculifera]
PRTLRMMYLHAWQSALWNAAASHRIRHYGHERVVVGDLVLPRRRHGASTTNGDDVEDAALMAADGGGGDGDVDYEMEDAAAAEGAEGAASAKTTTSAAGRLSAVRVVTEADVAAGRYDVFDVVLPLPGTEVSYPEHETGAWMRQAASEAG